MKRPNRIDSALITLEKTRRYSNYLNRRRQWHIAKEIINGVVKENVVIQQRCFTPHFVFREVSIYMLFELYPHLFDESIHSLISELSESELNILRERKYEFRIGADIIFNCVAVEKILKMYDANTYSSDEIAIKQYDDYVKLIDSIQQRFLKIISVKELAKYKLVDHADTLLMTCVAFCNTLWDIYQIDFNGPIGNSHIDDLTPNRQPYHFRRLKQLANISWLIHQYYKSESSTENVNVNIAIKNEPFDFSDPIYSKWFIRAIIQSLKDGTYPAQLGKEGELLSNLLKNKDGYESNEDFLKHLKIIADLDFKAYLPTKGTERSVVREICKSIHPIFCKVMDLPVETFKSEQLRLYNAILVLFEIDDFSKPRKDYKIESNQKSSNRCQISNRLTSLMKSS